MKDPNFLLKSKDRMYVENICGFSEELFPQLV